MDRKPVDSSNLVSVGYDADERILEVEFKGGAIYQYLDVPATVAQGLETAGSPGKFLNAEVKPTYSFRRL